MREYFKSSPNCVGLSVPGRTKLKQLWKEQRELVERSASAHAKCDRCSDLSELAKKCIGKMGTTAGKVLLSEQHKYLEQQHETFSETERKQLDMAGLTAIRFPDLIWTIIVDAATQRNFGAPVPD